LKRSNATNLTSLINEPLYEYFLLIPLGTHHGA